jgi:probable addiction module antidote protein
MTLKTTRFDPAEYLESPDAQAEFIAAALETGDAAYISHAFGVIAKARGMSQLARDTGLSRESLYRALSRDGNPGFSTILKVAHALGVKLTAEPARI